MLVGVQLATGFIAVALSAWLAYDRSLDLAANSLRLRLDVLAEEIEQRTSLSNDGPVTLSRPLRLDLSSRFPDPVVLLDARARPVATFFPSERTPGHTDVDAGRTPAIPENALALLETGDITIHPGRSEKEGGWALVPLYDQDGFPAGGVLVRPLRNSLARELAGTRQAYIRAVFLVAGLAVLTAVLLGGLFTLGLVRPLRRITAEVERIGRGDYAARVPEDRKDELGRLAAAVNGMARKVAESIKELRATDIQRRELIANVGHDLRTPLASMLGYIEEAERLLHNGAAGVSPALLHSAARQGAYLKQLLGDLFELSLIDSPSPQLRLEPVLPAELLRDIAARHRDPMEAAHIRFEVEIGAGLPLLQADGVRLMRLFDNLLHNALQHTPAGGVVRLTTEIGNELLMVRVEDTGAGMDAETLAHLFDRYYRGTDARTRTPEGTGLGLAISRAVARAHGGDIVAESSPGQGSRFTVTLPTGENTPLSSPEAPDAFIRG